MALQTATKTLLQNRTMLNAATAATGLFRNFSIKPHQPTLKKRELQMRHRCSGFHSVRCHIFKESGNGATPTIVIPGFVPDATEVVEFQRKLFKSFGDIYYINYPKYGFSTDVFLAQLADLVEEINNKGEKPILLSISFGCGLTYRFLSERETASLSIGGVVMVSPVFCTEDLVRPEGEKKGGIRIIESNLRRILKSDGGKADDVERQIERARRCFRSLFDSGADNRALTRRHLAIRGKIMDTIEKTSCRGGYERVLALKDFQLPDSSKSIFCGPALVLLAEAEKSMLVPVSPGLNLLQKRETLRSFLPNGAAATVKSTVPGDSVAHASLIFHHNYYNPLLESWYGIVSGQGMVTAI